LGVVFNYFNRVKAYFMETIYFCTPRFLLLMNSYSQRLYFAQGKQSEKEKIEEASFEECCWSGFKFLKLFQEIQNCFFRWTRQDWWKCLQKQSGLYSSLSTTMLPAFLLEIHFDPGNCNSSLQKSMDNACPVSACSILSRQCRAFSQMLSWVFLSKK
jgi:hypothetical protein